MDKKKFLVFFIFLSFFSFLHLHAAYTLDIKLRFFGGTRGAAAELPQFATSSYLRSTITASIESKLELEEEKKQVKRVFNLLNVDLITEADLTWSSDEGGKISYVILLGGREYLAKVTPASQQKKNQFRIEVFEQSGTEKVSLLDSEFILPQKNIAVFGFEDLQGNPYFLSIRVTEKPAEKIDSDITGLKMRIAKGAVKAEGEIKPPRLIKEVKVVYPEEAKKAGIEGIVILDVATDIYGRVVAVKVLKTAGSLLDQAAIDTVKQWVYEPMIIKGKPHPVNFTITVRFKLEKDLP